MNHAKVGKTKVEAGKAAGKGVVAKRRAEGAGRRKRALRAAAGANVVGGGIEVDEARQAYETSQGELAAVRAAEILARRVDMQRAAAVAHSVAVRDARPARRAEFERLVKVGLYNWGQLRRLKRLALAAWFIRYMLELGQFRASNASVPEGVVRQAQLVRARMMMVLDYWLGGVGEVALRLEFLRSGVGHQDLANDLQELARLYERADLQAVVRPGVPHYYEADGHDARALAAAIFAGLGLGDESEIERWSGLADRAWTLLARTYDDHRAKGVFLFAAQEDVAATYPSLISAVRSTPARRRSPEGPGAEPGQEPVDEPAVEPGPGSEDDVPDLGA